MTLKTYRAASIADALGQIKRDLGPGAVILHTRTFKHGGVLGFRAKRMVEITASSGVNVVHPLARKGKAPGVETSVSAERDGVAPSLRPPAETLRRAYGVAKAPVFTGVSETPVAVMDRPSGDAESASSRAGGPSLGLPVGDGAREAARHVVGSGRQGLAGPQAVWDEITVIKRLVGQVLHSTQGRCQPAMPEALFQRYLRLLEAEVATEVADEIVGAVRDELNADELSDDAVVHQAVLRRLAAYIPAAADAPRPGRHADGRPLTIALVGPTGVGKTTTIAKLAATYKLRHGRNVGLITCDTYRIAAVDQLRTYANIIGLPLKVALTPTEMANACESLRECDVVLIDTAGRSQHDEGRLTELSTFLESAAPHETHLVLSGAASQSVLLRASERFACARPNRIIFTKLDEVVNFGVILNASKTIGARLSFVTTGQEVPDHIEAGRADRLARLVLEGGAVR